MPSRLDALQTTRSVDFRRFLGRLHSVAKQASFNVASPSDFGGFSSDFARFGEAKMEAKIDFLKLFLPSFFRLRFGIDFGSFFGGSNHEKSLKTIGFSMVFVNFQKIAICEKVSNKLRFWRRFRKPKPRRIDKKLC